MERYGVSAFVGIGIPIPVLDEELAATLALTDADLWATVFDYGVAARSRPSLGRVSYAELRSGTIELEGRKIPAGPISSRAKARLIAETLKTWVGERRWTLTQPVAPLPGPGEQGVGPLEVRGPGPDAEPGFAEPPAEGTDEVEEVG